MPAPGAFSKKTATRYALVHRAQNDPLIHDNDAPTQILTEIPGPSTLQNNRKIKRRKDLENDFNESEDSLPFNEEVAAEHGVLFNDEYDYLQHLRQLGRSEDKATWIEATSGDSLKGKGKQKLEDALRNVRIDDERSDLGSNSDAGVFRESSTHLSSWHLYQEQQDIPDEIAGFQPDMDPRLREALEALDDEAYLDDDQDLFEELAGGSSGQEVTREDWEAARFEDEEDEGWESDDTAKAVDMDIDTSAISNEDAFSPESNVDLHGDGAFLESIAKAKASKHGPERSQSKYLGESPPVAPSTIDATINPTGRRKKRKGALTSSTGFSMTSSSLPRTEAMSTLDSRFDHVLDSYMDDIVEDDELLDDTASAVTGMSRTSGISAMSKTSSALRTEDDGDAPSLMSNTAFASAMDEYLASTGGKKGKRMKKGGKQGTWGQQSGMNQLDEIRKGLGPARFSGGEKSIHV